MRIAIFGATSEIAKDLILSMAKKNNATALTLLARRPLDVSLWLTQQNLSNKYQVCDFSGLLSNEQYDAIINFVGVGNPAKTAALGSGIFEITSKYDDLALQYVEAHPECKYIFLSSGAAYCSTFEEPANENTTSSIDLNHIKPQDWYGVAKLHAECRHRALAHLPIVDIRVFNYFSHTQDMMARFLITDIVRAIKNKVTFETSNVFMMRDYLHPLDFYQLVEHVLHAPQTNTVVDCYSQSPIAKAHLLQVMSDAFDLSYGLIATENAIPATGNKPYYFSNNKKAQLEFGYAPKYGSEQAIIEQTRLCLI